MHGAWSEGGGGNRRRGGPSPAPRSAGTAPCEAGCRWGGWRARPSSRPCARRPSTGAERLAARARRASGRGGPGRGLLDHAARVRMARRGWAPPGRVASAFNAAGTGLGSPRPEPPLPGTSSALARDAPVVLAAAVGAAEPTPNGAANEAPAVWAALLDVAEVPVGARGDHAECREHPRRRQERHEELHVSRARSYHAPEGA